MDAADSAGTQETNPGGRAGSEGAPDRRRAEDAIGDAHGEVSRTGLARRLAGFRKSRKLLSRQADPDRAADHADRSRHRAGLAHAPFGLERDAEPFPARKPVRDERRL